MRRRRRSFRWAHRVRYPRLYRLSDTEGLWYAQYASERSEELRRSPPGRPQPRSDLLEDVADYFHVSAKEVGISITQARRELFGNLSDTGIDKVLKRDEEIARRARRPQKCKVPDCPNTRPPDARSTWQFCKPACRVRWFRHPEWREEMEMQTDKTKTEQEERDAWIREQIEFRRYSGLTIPEIAKGLGISTRELERVGLTT